MGDRFGGLRRFHCGEPEGGDEVFRHEISVSSFSFRFRFRRRRRGGEAAPERELGKHHSLTDSLTRVRVINRSDSGLV